MNDFLRHENHQVDESSLIWERLSGAAHYREWAISALNRVYDELVHAHNAMLAATFQQTGLPPTLGELASALTFRRDDFRRERELEIDTKLWQTWFDQCGVDVLSHEKRRSYISLVQNSRGAWLPFTEQHIREARLAEVFEISTRSLFAGLPNRMFDDRIPQALVLPKAPNVKRLGPNDWRRDWLIRLVRVMQVLNPSIRSTPEGVIAGMEPTKSTKQSSCLLNNVIEIQLTLQADIHIRFFDELVLEELNRIWKH